MVEQRQVAERQRQLGNEAYKAKQFAEALRCYECGLETQKHSMALHANAAMAALKLKCYVQAMEHCDKVHDRRFNTPIHISCAKVQPCSRQHHLLVSRSAALKALSKSTSPLSKCDF